MIAPQPNKGLQVHVNIIAIFPPAMMPSRFLFSSARMYEGVNHGTTKDVNKCRCRHLRSFRPAKRYASTAHCYALLTRFQPTFTYIRRYGTRSRNIREHGYRRHLELLRGERLSLTRVDVGS